MFNLLNKHIYHLYWRWTSRLAVRKRAERWETHRTLYNIIV